MLELRNLSQFCALLLILTAAANVSPRLQTSETARQAPTMTASAAGADVPTGETRIAGRQALPIWPAGPLSPAFFGMHIQRPDIAWPKVNGGLGAVRIWDAGAQWADIAPAKGVFNWDALDAHVSRARANGADVIMNLGRTPRWASARPAEPSAYGPGQAAEPALDQYWQDWVRAVATRYQGKIRYWEVWNEPNDTAFFSGSAEKLVDLARQAYFILKTSNPDNQVLSPSPYNVNYLDYYLSLGGGDYADVIGYHFYLAEAPEALATWYIPSVRAVLTQRGQADKPLWNSEGGYLRPAVPGPKTLSDETGAAYLARAYLLNWTGGVSRFYFYAWDNHTATNIELTAADNTTLTAAGVAYRELSGWLLGAQLSELRVDEAGVWILTFDHPTHGQAYIVWHPTETIVFDLPAAWQVQALRSLAGAHMSLSGQRQLAVGPAPLLLESSPVHSLYLPTVSGPTQSGALGCQEWGR
ncbi:endo-1,4-beta-xylanase [Candidatus Amarolinea dominans]|uniref:endo-1,4-beta-xylanase n=1 Tax=Candidatus Amarolinea dominans TaxID=3140696 RepID=UPI003137653F|nr:cellulase family glycosylhydrolase [Anaerolineae bacterium]